MKTIVVHLTGGIGNILQTVPFMSYMRNAGNKVIAVRDKDAFSDEICKMVSSSYDSLVYEAPRHFDINRGNMLQTAEGKALVRKMPEWAAWFAFHGVDIPDKPSVVVDTVKYECPSSVVFAPCCKPNWPMKRWPHWQELVDAMPGCTVVGLPGDGNIKGRFIDFRGKTSLKQLGGLLADADYVVAEEGGIAHLACAVGTRTYIIYGGTDPVKNATPGNSVQISSGEPACQPCQFTRCYTEGSGIGRKYYGCRKNEMINGFVRCLASLSAQKIMKVITENGDNCLYSDFRRV